MSDDCIFCKIVNGEIPSEKVYEDSDLFAFKDIDPAATVHILIVPKEHFPTLNDVPENKNELLGKMLSAAKSIAKKFGVDESGYRTVINTGSGAGQVVFHLHMHLMGGRPFGKMG